LWSSQPTVAGGCIKTHLTRLPSSSAALQGLARTTLVGTIRCRRLPGPSVPYGTLGLRGPVHAGFACPPPSVIRVWLPSRRLAPSRTWPALFHAGSAYGVFPSERSPRPRFPGVIRRFPPRLPLSQTHARSNRGLVELEACNSATGYILSRIPRGLLWAFSPQRRRMLPWAFSLSRDFTMALADFSGPPPPGA